MAYLTTAISVEFPPQFIDLRQVGCSHLVMVFCEIREMTLGGSSEPDAEQDYILLRGYCKPAGLEI